MTEPLKRMYMQILTCVISTNYDGQSIDQVTANNFSACVGTCVEYNHATTTGICLGVTFNGPNDGAIGQCTLYSSISSESLADEEGNVQDSAMLVSSPDGTQYATPQPDPGFSGAPTQAPSIDPLSSETSGAPESTFTSTSIVYVTSCPPDVTDCPGTSLQTTDLESTSTATSSGLNATPIFTTTSSTVLNTSSSSSGSQSGVSSSIAMITTSTDLSSQQSTITSIVAFTEYRLQVVEICGNIPTSCMTSTSTSLLVSNKTELKCYPGPCAGIMTATDTMDVVETSFCIVGS